MFDSHYKAYVREREGVEVLEFDFGFALVKPLSDALYLQDIFVLPEHRQKGCGRHMLEVVEAAALGMGFNKVVGSCDPVANGATESMKAMFACGFSLKSCSGGLILLEKSIKGES